MDHLNIDFYDNVILFTVKWKNGVDYILFRQQQDNNNA